MSDLVAGTKATAYCVSQSHRPVNPSDLAVRFARLGALDKDTCFVFGAYEP